MQRIFLFALFLCLHWVAWGQESYEYRYWFDNSDAESQTGSLQPGEQRLCIDLTGLNDALHIFRFQVKDTAGECPYLQVFPENAGKRRLHNLLLV